jgi:hypothetical protein
MKLFALLCVLSVPVFAGTALAGSAGASDGALAVKNTDGRVVVNATRGGVIGHLDKGWLTIKDPNPNDGTGPIVNGADNTQALGERTTKYSGTNIRFRMIGGSYTITVNGSGIDMSVVGRGLVTIDGTDTTNGTYATNGDAAQPVPSYRFTFPLLPPAPAGG